MPVNVAMLVVGIRAFDNMAQVSSVAIISHPNLCKAAANSWASARSYKENSALNLFLRSGSFGVSRDQPYDPFMVIYRTYFHFLTAQPFVGLQFS